MPTGAIIGVVLLLGTRRDSHSQWAEPGLYHWLLAKPEALAGPIPCSGRLNIFEVEIPRGAVFGKGTRR